MTTENHEEKGFKLIFSQRLAGYLMQRGFVLLDMRKNMDQSNKNVYMFNDSNKLRAAIFDYGNLKNVNDY